MVQACRGGRCRWPKVKRVVERRYFGGLSTYAEITVAEGSVCDRDGVCWLAERDRLREVFAAENAARHEVALADQRERYRRAMADQAEEAYRQRLELTFDERSVDVSAYRPADGEPYSRDQALVSIDWLCEVLGVPPEGRPR